MKQKFSIEISKKVLQKKKAVLYKKSAFGTPYYHEYEEYKKIYKRFYTLWADWLVQRMFLDGAFFYQRA